MDVFEALADPIRRDLLTRLAAAPARVVDLAAAHPVSRPAISRHLRVLGEAGLVRATDHGRERHYELDRAPLAAVTDYVADLAARHPAPRPPVSERHLDALTTEVHRAGRDRRRGAGTAAGTSASPPTQEQTA